MGTTIAQRHTQTLGATKSDVSTKLRGGLEDSQGKEIGGDDDKGTLLVCTVRQILVIMDLTVAVGVGHKHTAHIITLKVHLFEGVLHDNLHLKRFATGLDESKCLGVGVGIDVELLLLAVAGGEGKSSSLSRSGTFVKQRSVGEIHASEVANHGLVVEKGLKTTLGDLSLVGSVLSVPAGVLQDVTEDYIGNDGVVVTHTDVGTVHLVLSHNTLEVSEELRLRAGLLEIELTLKSDASRNSLGDEFFHGGSASDLEHLRQVSRARANVSTLESVEEVERLVLGTICVSSTNAQRTNSLPHHIAGARCIAAHGTHSRQHLYTVDPKLGVTGSSLEDPWIEFASPHVLCVDT
eukprot:Colp12_sorted_trinity150504_noHs@10335